MFEPHFHKRSALRIFFSTSPFLWLLVVLSSCLTPRYYTPGRNPVPFFKQKGDTYADLSTNLINKGDITLGYAFGRGLAAYAGAGYSSERTSDVILKPPIAFNSTGHLFNFGAGYYLNEIRSYRFRFEMFADMVFGRYRIIKHPGYDEYLNPVGNTAMMSGAYQKTGLLINFGYIGRNPDFRYGYTVRTSRITFDQPTLVEPTRLTGELERIRSKPAYHVIEHGIFGRYGKKVAVQMQLAFYHGLFVNPETGPIQQFNLTYMLGVVFTPSLGK